MSVKKAIEKKGLDLDRAIGQRLRDLRERADRPRALVALVARQWGFQWSGSTLALIENGRRRLTFGEWCVLPHVMTLALGPYKEENEEPRHYTYFDLLPKAGSGRLVLTPQLFIDEPENLRALLSRGGVIEQTPNGNQADFFDRPDAREMQHHDETTLGAARVLHVPMRAVIDAAQRKWGHPLAEERNRRLEAISEQSPRAQALRGHITRQLVNELKPIIARTGRAKKKNRTTTRRKP